MAETVTNLGQKTKRRVGIVGYGTLGKFLTEAVLKNECLELAFVWNRSPNAMRGTIDQDLILENLQEFTQRQADLIVEVAHPCISDQYGEAFLSHADYMIGSPTALAEARVESKLRKAAKHNGLYVPAGALWGGEDIKKMADRGSLHSLKITMTKHPHSLKLNGELADRNAAVTTERTVLYDGPVRGLCPLAPNNVNTMAAAAMAAHNLGFDGTQGSLVADPNLHDWHIVDIEISGPPNPQTGHAFTVNTVRKNPSTIGHVTGTATYGSFVESMIRAYGKGPGVHLC